VRSCPNLPHRTSRTWPNPTTIIIPKKNTRQKNPRTNPKKLPPPLLYPFNFLRSSLFPNEHSRKQPTLPNHFLNDKTTIIHLGEINNGQTGCGEISRSNLTPPFLLLKICDNRDSSRICFLGSIKFTLEGCFDSIGCTKECLLISLCGIPVAWYFFGIGIHLFEPTNTLQTHNGTRET
jgi:hypothetical protein